MQNNTAARISHCTVYCTQKSQKLQVKSSVEQVFILHLSHFRLSFKCFISLSENPSSLLLDLAIFLKLFDLDRPSTLQGIS